MKENVLNEIKSIHKDEINKMNVEGLTTDFMMGLRVEDEIPQLETKFNIKLTNGDKHMVINHYNEELINKLSNYILQ